MNWRRALNGWGVQPARPDQPSECRPAPARVVVGHAAGVQSADAARLQRHHVSPQPEQHRAGARRRHRGSDLGISPEVSGGAGQSQPGGDGVGRPQRSVAIWDDKIYHQHSRRAHRRALDARTGTIVWDTIGRRSDSKGYGYTSGPIIVNGKVVSGMTGCARYKDDVCFISAHDARTGKQAVAHIDGRAPGEPGGDTWGDLPLVFRAGGDAWIPGSYDPAMNLIYWATAQAKPWARAVRGTDGDALYTNSTLALDPDTGKIVWYYQHLPGEIARHGRSVREHPRRRRRPRQSLFKMGKIGVLWELDRKTGKFLNAFDLGYQTLMTIDRADGQGHVSART